MTPAEWKEQRRLRDAWLAYDHDPQREEDWRLADRMDASAASLKGRLLGKRDVPRARPSKPGANEATVVLRSDGATFRSVADAGRSVGAGHSTILSAMREGKFTLGYRWYDMNAIMDEGERIQRRHRERQALRAPAPARKAVAA